MQYAFEMDREIHFETHTGMLVQLYTQNPAETTMQSCKN